ncbi:MAG: hypothetical protein QXK37_05975 [Candidatus Woesearchaeota archaeon]
MKWKFKDILDKLDESDLYQLEQDLKPDSYRRKLVKDKIKENERAKIGFCVTCGNDLKTYPRSYTLIFGPDDFRKKASFCEIDCLQYFLSKLKHGEKNELQKNG